MPTVFITGASRGLGFGLAEVYSRAGWKVIAAIRNPDPSSEGYTKLVALPNTTVERLEVTDNAAVDALALKYKHIPIDVLINNAGVLSGINYAPITAPPPALTLPSLEEFDSTYHINVYAPLKIALAFLPSLLLSPNPKIVGMSSVLGSIKENTGFFSSLYVYRSSKTALNSLYKCLSLDLAPQKVTTIVIHPGWVQTDAGGKNADITVEVSVTGMKQVIDGLTFADTGRFLKYDGTELPW